MTQPSEERSARGMPAGRGSHASSAAQQERLSASSILDPLIAFAEELGRLLARREVLMSRSRRAYALPELLFGAGVMTAVWVLIARALGWLAH